VAPDFSLSTHHKEKLDERSARTLALVPAAGDLAIRAYAAGTSLASTKLLDGDHFERGNSGELE
jgi:hypothetical protein